MMKKLIAFAFSLLLVNPLYAASLNHYQPGFRTINGSTLNLMVDAVNNLTGNGTPGPITGTTGVFSGQLRTTFGTPTIASGACGTTTNGVITSGTNQAGLITIGSASTTTCTVSFSATLTNAPNACVVFPASAGAAATGTTVAYVSSITTAQFVITGSALASTAYYYFCM